MASVPQVPGEKLKEWFLALVSGSVPAITKTELASMIDELALLRTIFSDLSEYVIDSEDNKMELLPIQHIVALLTQTEDVDTLLGRTPETQDEEDMRNVIYMDEWLRNRG